MTLLCCAIFAHDLDQVARDLALAAERGADVVELRIDSFDAALDTALIDLTRRATISTIVTCRAESEGGMSSDDDATRLRRMKAFDSLYVDLEIASLSRLPSDLDLRSKLIASSHDFKTRPPRLLNTFAELNDGPADVAKLVWTARSIRDNQEAFELLSQRQKPTIAVCMGEAGLLSRILAKKFGAFLTFASLDEDAGTAPGQVSLDAMKRLHRWDAIDANTRVFGVVGSPVKHSLSPLMHNAAFEALGINAVYVPLLVEPSYESFKAFMETFVRGDGPLKLDGLSVTIPHKENALRYLRESGGSVSIESLAADLGAINTVDVKRNGDQVVLAGSNTDYAAIVECVTHAVGQDDLSETRVAILGAGGTGRTAAAAMARCGAAVTIYNRTFTRAEAIAKEIGVFAMPWEALGGASIDVLINTTPIGLSPNIDASPLDGVESILRPGMVVFDTVYNPLATKLIRQARAAGAKTVLGVEMFVRQGARQFELWTGQTPPIEVMRKVVERSLSDGLR